MRALGVTTLVADKEFSRSLLQCERAWLRPCQPDVSEGSGLPVADQPPRRTKHTRKQQVEEHRWNATGLHPTSSGG